MCASDDSRIGPGGKGPELGTLAFLWGKTDRKETPRWNPLVQHLLDVAASADAILVREPQSTRDGFAEALGLPWDQARPWLLTVIACHDLGKACPGFQCKVPQLQAGAGLPLPRSPDHKINHAYVSQAALLELLPACGWAPGLSELAADAVGSHHGSRCPPDMLVRLQGNRRALGDRSWFEARQRLLEAIRHCFGAYAPPTTLTLTGPDFMRLAGLTSFADWIGSNDTWFPFSAPDACQDLPARFRTSLDRAHQALDAIGWSPRVPLSATARSFAEVFHFDRLRPLQESIVEALAQIDAPGLLLVEAPMGEGKTEAALFAHLELQRRFGHRGLYVALPTKATGNAMFSRVHDFLDEQGGDRNLDLQLLHGATFLNEEFQSLRIRDVDDGTGDGTVRAREWFTHKKRALLSEYGVGTVDQALVPILPVRHNFVRLWGLANRVVVFDEIHAYDTYTGTLLFSLIRWLLSLRSSVVLLSATLSPGIRRSLADLVEAELPDQEPSYPRLTHFAREAVTQTHFEAAPERRCSIAIHGVDPSLSEVHAALMRRLPDRAAAMALVNTVQRAQQLYQRFEQGSPLLRNGHRVGKRLADGSEIYLFHARFPAGLRQLREDQALAMFGRDGERTVRRILIATQVAEQSLDLDFDLIVTDLAPVDLLLQRAGRLFRHQRPDRPLRQAALLVAGLLGDEPPSFGKPLWWSAVYPENLLLRTWLLLRQRQRITLPDEIDAFVQDVYERRAPPPASLRERLERAQSESARQADEQHQLALRAIVGSPADASWNDPARFVLYDEDEPGTHRTLMAQTRLGDDSVTVIPIEANETAALEEPPELPLARTWSLRAIGISRRSLVAALRDQGAPAAWSRSPLLRSSYPLVLDERRCWVDDQAVQLDDDLGLVYEPKEYA